MELSVLISTRILMVALLLYQQSFKKVKVLYNFTQLNCRDLKHTLIIKTGFLKFLKHDEILRKKSTDI